MTAKRRFTIIIQEDPEGGYAGRCLELRGAISEGKTLEELRKNMTEAIELVLESLEENAKKYKKLVIEIPS
ncbi:MAG: type II toxin-antitoxin system HicB family antitoxin [Thaumarchaeota archaeon]|nr:type II toxin-antitoxin system HicB family antitoxin [Nitrososphaerota archaeon]MDE1838760.1 type II toxin-antitoxin system HicB family antitoxin [Nitrososphaerota archaeon]